MADARLRRFDAVVVWKLDRWGRSLVNCLNRLEDPDRLGIRFIVPGQGIDTDKYSPVGRLLMHVLGAVGQFERELERVHEQTLPQFGHLEIVRSIHGSGADLKRLPNAMRCVSSGLGSQV
jgi:hypothetical protein